MLLGDTKEYWRPAQQRLKSSGDTVGNAKIVLETLGAQISHFLAGLEISSLSE
jgi:hypothetical protein